jgi:hypothetical protein
VSESNGSGNPKPEWLERLERVEASHVKLMTDHEVWTRDQERLFERWEREREADRAEWKQRDEAYDKRFKEMGEALDARIAGLVSAMGAFVAKRDGGTQ